MADTTPSLYNGDKRGIERTEDSWVAGSLWKG